MKNIILVDGNNLLFRSYYATAYSGNFMNNSKGFPTNGIYGLVNMLNKIIKEEKPEYMLVAFDKGKTFRHEQYSDYKAGRSATPEELKMQFKVAKELIPLMGIKSYEIDNYEADDIIGTYSMMASNDKDFKAIIVSSDKDLLQLINDETEVKLLKSKDYIRMTRDEFKKEYGIEPIRMIDLKGLMGDSSDNIPGVKGIGEKTALKLLQEYDTVENLYNNIDNLKGATRDKLVNDKENAFKSKDLATIYTKVPVEYSLDELKYVGPDTIKLKKMYEELEFFSFLKNDEFKVKKEENISFKEVKEKDELILKDDIAVYIELDGSNYHTSDIIGASVYDGENAYYLDKEFLINNKDILDKYNKYTYDIKKNIVALNKYGIKFNKCDFDTMIATYILNYNEKDDISVVSNIFGYDVLDYNSLLKEKDENKVKEEIIKKAKFIFDTKDRFIDEMKEENSYDLFNKIEMKLSLVLADMELTGIRVDKNVLNKMGEKIKEKIDEYQEEIYKMSGEEFNIQSPKQLADVLFNKLAIPYPKKKATSYSTSREILDKIKDEHEIVQKIIDYRTLAKLYSTYIVGINDMVMDDGKLHTIYTQTLTRTGRLSSIEPNLQNIPIRYEEGKLIRKAFVPEEDSVFISSDYSQIELRVFAHMSNEENMINAFNSEDDIHTKTASEIFHVSESEVTKNMRRSAKAVNFGILYGISSFGLSEDLKIPIKEAKEFIDKYLEAFPKIKEYKQKTLDDAYKNGYVLTLMNRKRKIDELKNANYIIRAVGERMALNTPVQGTSADILKLAMINIYEELNKRKLKTKMLLQIHDELIFNVPESEKDEVKKLIKEKMENVYKLKVPLKVELEEGKNWYDAK